MRIVFLPETLVYFNRLADILYEQGYFSFKDSSLKYVYGGRNEMCRVGESA